MSIPRQCSGSRLTSSRRRHAHAAGVRCPASQCCTKTVDTPSSAANSGWLAPTSARVARTAGPSYGSGFAGLSAVRTVNRCDSRSPRPSDSASSVNALIISRPAAVSDFRFTGGFSAGFLDCFFTARVLVLTSSPLFRAWIWQKPVRRRSDCRPRSWRKT